MTKHLKVEYRQFETEIDLLNDFLDWWSDALNCPDLVTGWNIQYFDIPYLVNRIARVIDNDAARKLSPWGGLEQKTTFIKGRENLYYHIDGIPQLDYMDLFKKFTVNTYGAQESYKLDFIAEVVLGENKISYSDDYSSLDDLYEQNPSLFYSYNLVDVELIEKMDEKIGLLNLVFTLAYLAGVNYTDTLGTVAMWDSIIFRRLAKEHIAAPPNKYRSQEDYEGAFVKETLQGKFDWVTSYDLNSLYPMLMIQYNMSPETIVEHMKVHDLTPEKILADPNKNWAPEDGLAIAANGACFRTDKQGYLPKIIQEIYDDRVKYKKKMLAAERKLQKSTKGTEEYRMLEQEIDLASNKQMCLKIALNSLYGAFANRFCRYYSIDVAEGITLSGQLVVQSLENAFNNFLAKACEDITPIDRVIAMDTDSCIIALGDVINKVKPKDPHQFCIDFAQSALEPIIAKTNENVAKITNAYKNTMGMKLEKVAERAIFFKKKRYILKVLSSEGVHYKEPKIVVKGVEAIKSSTPKICRDEFRKIFDVMIDGTQAQLHKRVADFRTVFNNQAPEKIAMPKSVSNVKKYMQNGKVPYVSGTPMNSRAAILYNKVLKDLGIATKYEPIGNGDRLKYVFLKPRNPINENVIAFSDKIPPEIMDYLGKYIDYDMLFEKSFLHPLELLLKVIKWDSEPKANLDDFFF
jgi:DNA polymerase elongation subunit (family B)